MGAYLQLLTPCIPLLGRYMYPGIYKFESHTLDLQGVFTNKTPTDAYRGAGRPEATFVIERIMDELAAELSLDPIEVRRRNWIKHDEFPYTTIAGLTYDSGNYEAATKRRSSCSGTTSCGASRPSAGSVATRAARPRASPPTPRCAGWRRPVAGRAGVRRRGLGGGHRSHAGDRQGRSCHRHVAARAGPRDHVRADRRGGSGVPFDDVDVIHGDTLTAPFGLDTYGSRSLAVGGVAVQRPRRRSSRRPARSRRT